MREDVLQEARAAGTLAANEDPFEMPQFDKKGRPMPRWIRKTRGNNRKQRRAEAKKRKQQT